MLLPFKNYRTQVVLAKKKSTDSEKTSFTDFKHFRTGGGLEEWEKNKHAIEHRCRRGRYPTPFLANPFSVSPKMAYLIIKMVAVNFFCHFFNVCNCSSKRVLLRIGFKTIKHMPELMTTVEIYILA